MLQRLIVFAVNTGIWTAVFALLTVVLVRVASHLSIVYPDPNTLAARLPIKRVLRPARLCGRLALL